MNDEIRDFSGLRCNLAVFGFDDELLPLTRSLRCLIHRAVYTIPNTNQED